MSSNHDDGFRGGRTGVVAIAVGAEHGLALRVDGTVVAWGNAYKCPAGLTGVTAIAAGKSHSLALKGDGTVVAWGHSNTGQTDVPVGLTGVVAIAAGLAHNLALKSDGSVVAWGFNDKGQTDVPAGLTGVTAIAAGWWHSLALRSDGSVIAWGHSDSDQRHVPYGLTGAVAISAGYENSSAIFADGTVIDWGNDTNFLEVPGEFHGATGVAYGYRHRLARTKNGTVVSDGYFFGGISVPATLTDVVAIAGAPGTSVSSHFLALTRDGAVVGLGIAGREVSRALDVPAELTGNSTLAAETGVARTDVTDQSPIRLNADQGRGWDDIILMNGKTALMHSAAIGDEGRLLALLDDGADVGAVDDDGDGVLSYAISSRNVRVLDMLLRSGADPNASSSSKQAGFPVSSVLHVVVQRGWSEGLQELIKHGADVSLRASAGVTPMMLAAGAGQDACVSDLRRAGADVSAVDGDGDSVLYFAASNGRSRTVDLLLALGADPDPSPGSSGTALAAAAQQASPFGRRSADIPPSDFTRIVVALLRAGADASSMYDAGLVLQRVTERGSEIAPRELVNELVATHDHWSVIYLTPEGRSRLAPAPSASRAAKSSGRIDRTLARARVRVVGSTQTGFVNKPTVKVYWNGKGTAEGLGDSRTASRCGAGGWESCPRSTRMSSSVT